MYVVTAVLKQPTHKNVLERVNRFPDETLSMGHSYQMFPDLEEMNHRLEENLKEIYTAIEKQTKLIDEKLDKLIELLEDKD